MLDDLKTLRRLDKSNLLDRVAELPEQCRDGWQQGLDWSVPDRVKSLKQLLVLGMGGSAIGADLLQGMIGDQFSRPGIVNRTYTIPRWVGRDTLVLVCSYSGNTEETLSGAQAAARQGATLMAITSGGRLADWAVHSRIPLLRIPQGLPPRAAVGYLTFVPMALFAQLGWVSKKSLPVEQAYAGAKRFIAFRLAPSVPTRSNPAKQIARSLVGRLPVLYGPAGGWEGITYRWRTQIEENSKSLAFHHIFPEATHNEISGWFQPKSVVKKTTAVFISDPAVHPRILQRMEFTKRIIRTQGARVVTLQAPGRSILERMLGLITLGDFVSVYLGLLYRIDPTPVERVEALKKHLKGSDPLGSDPI